MKIETLRLLAILALVAMGVLYFARQPRAQENRAVENHTAVTPTAADLASAPKVTKSDAEWKAQLTPAQYAVARGKGTESPRFQRFVARASARRLSLCRLRRSPLRERWKIRVGHRLAEFHQAVCSRQCHGRQGQ